MEKKSGSNVISGKDFLLLWARGESYTAMIWSPFKEISFMRRHLDIEIVQQLLTPFAVNWLDEMGA